MIFALFHSFGTRWIVWQFVNIFARTFSYYAACTPFSKFLSHIAISSTTTSEISSSILWFLDLRPLFSAFCMVTMDISCSKHSFMVPILFSIMMVISFLVFPLKVSPCQSSFGSYLEASGKNFIVSFYLYLFIRVLWIHDIFCFSV